ncbi:hypothetical protein [Catellatospora citrea]|nr:hypothetical protein [Catellatospora citrea]
MRRGDAPTPSPRTMVAAVVLTWVAVIVESTMVPAHPLVQRMALFVHLASLLVGFGAVITVDWFALRWLLRRAQLRQVMAVAHEVHLLIWLGIAGLATSGALLRPDLGSTPTQVKLALVLAIALNGIQATAVHRRMADLPGRVPRLLLVRSALVALLSQAGWWGAMTIGFLNSHPS